jgi:alginate O-acetyltransferase complex protein AlgI
MTFVSFEFIVLFAVFLPLYLVATHRLQNVLLLVTSYVFYGWWDVRFCSLLLLSSTVDFLCGLLIERAASEAERRQFMTIGLTFNLLTLCIFKYFDFFALSLEASLGRIGVHVSLPLLHVILPIGISFYTFQTMSYTIDVFLREVKATTRYFDFLIFVSFFPHLVAGPIMRARNLLPQVLQPRQVTMEKLSSGAALMLWGYFKKIVIADNMGLYADQIFSQPAPSGAQILFAVYAFAFQIYGDFSGYSDIARGCARMIGFEIISNFNLPFLAASASEFWRRWHISLSLWIRDYFYIPLGGNRQSPARNAFNILFVMTVVGLWHGAANHFVLWGTFQGLLLLLYRAIGTINQRYLGIAWAPNSVFHWLSVLLFFNINCFGWLLFRCSSVFGQMIPFLRIMIHRFTLIGFDWSAFGHLGALAAFLVAVELVQFHMRSLEPWLSAPSLVRAGFYTAACYAIAILAPERTLGFIYFAF